MLLLMKWHASWNGMKKKKAAAAKQLDETIAESSLAYLK